MPNIMPYDRRGHNLWNGLDNFERMFFDGFGSQQLSFRTDIEDKGDHYMLSAELPGVKKEDINVELRGENLIISAKCETESSTEEKHFVRKERRSGSYSRSFDISGIDTDGIKARYENGILQIALPKAQDAGNGKKQIDIG